MAITEDYLRLFTSQYQGSTKFLAWMQGLIDKLNDAINTANLIAVAHDLDIASGVQLDTLGVIIGLARDIHEPITGLWFSWYDGSSPTEDLGWGEGSWMDPAESTGAMTTLADDAYRQLLKFKVIQNQWKGTMDELYHTWEIIFAGDNLDLKIEDNQDMSMTVTVTGHLIPATVQYILLGNYLPLKPAGVSITYVFNES